jgi:hypothetical protein
MKLARSLEIAIAAVAAVALSGCGVGPGESTDGDATLTVTRDHGSQQLLEATQSEPTESDTVIRMLDREAEITTRYGGGFVQSIEGIAGEIEGGRSLDWFFFVNGIESPTGAADVPVRGGDRVWWDYRDWTDAMRAPAVVGSWPEPFAQEAAGTERLPVQVACHGDRPPCATVAERLADAGVEASVEPADEPPQDAAKALRLLVGPWPEVAADRAASQLDDGPATSGVFARFRATGGALELEAMDDHARTAATLGPGAGLIAALRDGQRPPTWLITGVDAEGVERAADSLDEGGLASRYAVAVAADGEKLALPVRPAE